MMEEGGCNAVLTAGTTNIIYQKTVLCYVIHLIIEALTYIPRTII